MMIPCEVVVWYVLPMIRKELAAELVHEHSMSQSEVARRFGLTEAAISQYIRKKRGDCSEIELSPSYPVFMKHVKQSAARIADEETVFENEVCRLCNIVRTSGLLAEIYEMHVGEPLSTCENFGTSAGINDRD